MRVLLKLTWVELKLFLREPTTLVFTFAFPVVLLFVMGEIFGGSPVRPGEVLFAGLAPLDYYVPAYMALAAMSAGIIMLPSRLTAYRSGGVLRRFRASLVPVPAVLGSQVLAGLVLALIGAARVVLRRRSLRSELPRRSSAVDCGFSGERGCVLSSGRSHRCGPAVEPRSSGRRAHALLRDAVPLRCRTADGGHELDDAAHRGLPAPDIRRERSSGCMEWARLGSGRLRSPRRHRAGRRMGESAAVSLGLAASVDRYGVF